MANPNGHAATLIPFKPGQSGNPGGRPVGARNRLQGDFLNALAEDFAANGKDAIVAARKRNPTAYIGVIARLMPRELNITEDSTDDEVLALIKARLAMRRGLSDTSAAGESTAP